MNSSCDYLHYFVAMKKRIIALIILWLFIWWCTKKVEKPIIFDQYSITLTTKYSYQEINTNNIPWSPAIKQYLQENETWFAWSIIIAKNQLQTGLDISTLANNNSKSITRKIAWADKPSTSEFSFDCWSGEIDWVIQKVEIEEWDETQYLNQLFFVNENYLYGISTMTTDKSENKNLAKNIKNITCPTTVKK